MRLTFGDYFAGLDSSNVLQFVFDTKDLCEDLFIQLKPMDYGFLEDQLQVNCTILRLDTIDSNNAHYQYVRYVHRCQYQESSKLVEGQKFEYMVYSTQDNRPITNKLFRSHIPCMKYCSRGMSQRYLIYGDFDAGIGDENNPGRLTQNYFRTVADSFEDYEGFVFLGDYAYEQQYAAYQTNGIDQNFTKGELYKQKVSQYWSTYPHIFTLGNHEAIPYQGSYYFNYTNGQYYSPNYTQGKNKFYKVYGQNVVFLNFDPYDEYYGSNKTNEVYEQIFEQLEIIEKQRLQNDFFLIVFSHYPIYYSENTTEKELKTYTKFKKFEQLFQQYKVDLYLNAHVHQYQRFEPIYDNKTGEWNKSQDNVYRDKNFPIYIVNGAAGNQKDFPTQYTQLPNMKKIYDKPSVGRLTIHNSSSLQYEQIDSRTGEVVDEFWIIKTRPTYSYLASIILLMVSVVFFGIAIGLIIYKKWSRFSSTQTLKNNNDLQKGILDSPVIIQQ